MIKYGKKRSQEAIELYQRRQYVGKRFERAALMKKARRKLVSCDLLFIQISKGTAPQRQLSEGKRKGNAGIRCASSHTA